MGDRGVIAYIPHGDRVPTTVDKAAAQNVVGIYLHWHGSPESIEAFLRAAKDYGVRPDIYGLARLSQIIGNYIGGTLSLGIGPVGLLDTSNSDNGTYVVQDWEIVGRLHAPDYSQRTYVASADETYVAVREANDEFFGEVRLDV